MLNTRHLIRTIPRNNLNQTLKITQPVTPPTRTAIKRSIETAILTKNTSLLIKYHWYIQYTLPRESWVDAQDIGERALVFPTHTLDLPSIPVYPNPDFSENKPLTWYWRNYIEPQKELAHAMLLTIESMYRQQQREKDLGRVTFTTTLTHSAYAEKLGYKLWEFPNHPYFIWDHICKNCGGITQFNSLLGKVGKETCC